MPVDITYLIPVANVEILKRRHRFLSELLVLVWNEREEVRAALPSVELFNLIREQQHAE